MTSEEKIVRDFWKAFDDLAWDRATALLHEDVEVRWVQTREIFRGRSNFIAANQAYPGQWRVIVDRAVGCGPDVVTGVTITDGEIAVHAASFFHIEDGLITAMTEYWTDPTDPPAWRLEGGWSETY